MALTTAIQRDHSEPLGDMNTTPLIDVMLVLLIMFIITIPPATHKIGMDLPGEPPRDMVNPIRNVLTLDAAGSARWNGARVGDTELAALLQQVAAMTRPAEVHFAPDAAARFERVDEILALAKHAGVRGFGFVGNDRYRQAF